MLALSLLAGIGFALLALLPNGGVRGAQDELASPPAENRTSAILAAVGPEGDVAVVAAPDAQMHLMKLGVLLLNLGGPTKIEDVEGFLFNLFSDPDIIRLPWFLAPLQKPLASFISKRRAPKSALAYQRIGGGSPIVNYTTAQADLLQKSLVEKGFLQTRCYFAMRYWHPFTEEVLDRIREDAIQYLVVLPLYPQFSISTTGSSLSLLKTLFEQDPTAWGPSHLQHTVISSWYQRPGYLQVMAKLIIGQMVSFEVEDLAQSVHVLFSAHGVPQSYIAAGDPYQEQVEDCSQLIAQEVRIQLGASQIADDEHFSRLRELQASNCTINATDCQGLFFHLSYQSRVGPVKWLEPYTEDILQRLGKYDGARNLIVVPVSFVSEHIETLEEIDMEYRHIAEESGISNWRRAPALNTNPEFIQDLASLVVEALAAPPVTVEKVASLKLGNVDRGSRILQAVGAAMKNGLQRGRDIVARALDYVLDITKLFRRAT